jgi:hypothetical protein
MGQIEEDLYQTILDSNSNAYMKNMQMNGHLTVV